MVSDNQTREDPFDGGRYPGGADHHCGHPGIHMKKSRRSFIKTLLAVPVIAKGYEKLPAQKHTTNGVEVVKNEFPEITRGVNGDIPSREEVYLYKFREEYISAFERSGVKAMNKKIDNDIIDALS